jgi:hypothetical protein
MDPSLQSYTKYVHSHIRSSGAQKMGKITTLFKMYILFEQSAVIEPAVVS